MTNLVELERPLEPGLEEVEDLALVRIRKLCIATLTRVQVSMFSISARKIHTHQLNKTKHWDL